MPAARARTLSLVQPPHRLPLAYLSLQQIVFRVLALLLISGVVGLLISATARLLGDRGVSHDGNLTPNPFVHLDLLAVVAIVFARVGWIRPIAVDPAEMRIGRAGLVVCAVAAFLGALAVALILYALRQPAILWLPGSIGVGTVAWLRTAADMAVAFAVVNVLPFPPFAGGYLLQAVAPDAFAAIRKVHFVVALVLAAICISGLAEKALRVFADPLGDWLLR